MGLAADRQVQRLPTLCAVPVTITIPALTMVEHIRLALTQIIAVHAMTAIPAQAATFVPEALVEALIILSMAHGAGVVPVRYVQAHLAAAPVPAAPLPAVRLPAVPIHNVPTETPVQPILVIYQALPVLFVQIPRFPAVI